MKTFFQAILKSVVCLLALSSCTGGVIDDLDIYKSEFDTRPEYTPTDKTPDAPLAGNGDIGLTMCPAADKVRFYIAKNDFWKSVESYPHGGIALPGWLDLSSSEICEGEYHAEQLPGSAEIRASFTTPQNVLHITAWVAATDNKIVLELDSAAETTVNVELSPCTGNGSKTETGFDYGCSWFTRSFEDLDNLAWPDCVAVAVNCGEELHLDAGEKAMIVLCAYSSFDAPDCKETALREAAEVTGPAVLELKRDHRDWWDSFWRLSHVSIGDPFLEKYYYTSQYLFACSSRAGKFSPGLWGSFITQDETAWAGDYHLNYNYQSPYWGCYSSNQLCLVDNYDKPILDYMEKGEQLASELLGCRGVYYPVGIGPMGYTSSAWPVDPEEMLAHYGTFDNRHDAGMMFWGQKSNASFCAINMMMRFYSTWDAEYARRIYPFIKACAVFWEDFLVCKDGVYVDRNDDFYEECSWDGHEPDVNAMCSLGLIHMVMKGADDISRFLDVDAGCRDRWETILNNLSPYPTYKLPDGRETLLASERSGNGGERTLLDYRMGLNRVMMHGILIPSRVCGPHLTPEMNDIMLSDLRVWDSRRTEGEDWGRSLGNGIETVYAGAARVGFPAADIIDHLKERIALSSNANGHITAEGGGVETLAAVPFAVNEMLLQSFEGVVRVFPNWDRSRDASFETLRAEGAFLVSSSIKRGEVVSVRVLSEKGRLLEIENPWPGCSVKVRRAGGKGIVMTGETLSIPTSPGEVIRISR